MINRNKIRAHALCFCILFVTLDNSYLINAQSTDDLNIVTTILPELSDIINSNNQQVNKTSTTTTTTTVVPSISDLNADASDNFKSDDQCKHDAHCEQPNQFCKQDEQTGLGKCVCSKGFKGEQCDQITDCSMCTNRSKCFSKNNTLSCSCRNGKFFQLSTLKV